MGRGIFEYAFQIHMNVYVVRGPETGVTSMGMKKHENVEKIKRVKNWDEMGGAAWMKKLEQVVVKMRLIWPIHLSVTRQCVWSLRIESSENSIFFWWLFLMIGYFVSFFLILRAHCRSLRDRHG